MDNISPIIQNNLNKNYNIYKTVFDELKKSINKQIDTKLSYYCLNFDKFNISESNLTPLTQKKEQYTFDFEQCSVLLNDQDSSNNSGYLKLIASKCNQLIIQNYQGGNKAQFIFENLQNFIQQKVQLRNHNYSNNYSTFFPKADLKSLSLSGILVQNLRQSVQNLDMYESLQEINIQFKDSPNDKTKNKFFENLIFVLNSLSKSVRKLNLNSTTQRKQFLTKFRVCRDLPQYSQFMEKLTDFIRQRDMISLSIKGIAIIGMQRGILNKVIQQTTFSWQRAFKLINNLFQAIKSKPKLCQISFSPCPQTPFSEDTNKLMTQINERRKYCLILAKRKSRHSNLHSISNLSELLISDKFLNLLSPYVLEQQID